MFVVSIFVALVSVAVPEYVNEQFKKEKFEFEFSEEEIEGTTKGVLSYRLLSPDPVREGRRYPLIIWLSEFSAANNKDQLQYIHETFLMRLKSADCPYYIFAPDLEDVSYADFVSGVDDKTDVRSETHQPRSMQLLDACIRNLIDEHAIDIDKVYLISLGAAGRIAWDHMAMNLDLYAAYLGFNVPLNGIRELPSNNTTPVWFFFSFWDASEHVSVAKNIVSAFAENSGKAAINYAAFTQKPNSSVSMAFEQYELLDWLFLQARSSELAPPPGQDLLLQIQNLEFWKARAYRLGGIVVAVLVLLKLYIVFKKKSGGTIEHLTEGIKN